MQGSRWKTLQTRLIGTFSIKQVELPTGKRLDYLIVGYPESVGVLALDDQRQVIMAGQHRYAIDEYSWEIPTGGRSGGESLEECARRELEEETGYRAGHVEPLLSFHPSNAASDQVMHIYVATELSFVGIAQNHDEPAEELIQVELIALDEVLDRVLQGSIRDAATIIAVLFYANRLRGSTQVIAGS